MRYLTIIFCAILVLFSLQEAQGKIIHVPGDAPTIQAGIDSAAAGDTVLLADGTFTGAGNRSIDYHGKAITVRSLSANPDSCVIDCEGSSEGPHRGFYFHSGEGSESVLQEVTITNGYARHGGGIRSDSSSSPTLIDCIFSGNSAKTFGGGLYCRTSAPTLINCTFSSNWTIEYGNGGGMYSCHFSTPTLTNCIFSSNSSHAGGGMMCEHSPAALTDCTFSGNSSVQSGGGMLCHTASPTLIRCTFSGNSALIAGGGMYCTTTSSPTLTNCTFSGNLAQSSGGGMMCNSYSSATLENTIIAFSTDGEAVACDGISSATLTCCDVYGNAGGDWVGCITGQDTIPGNISCDPMFCYPDTGNYYLAGISCCVGAGCDSLGNPDSTVDIGAFGVGCPPSPPSPFSLLFPPNKAFTPRVVRFDWETATDPDPSDQVNYDLYVSTSYYFPSDSTAIDSNLVASECLKVLDYGTYYWKVKAKDNWGDETWSNQIRYFMVTGIHASLGDFNGDGSIDIADVVFSINYLYNSGPASEPLEAGDANCDGTVNIADAVYLISYLFIGGPPPVCK